MRIIYESLPPPKVTGGFYTGSITLCTKIEERKHQLMNITYNQKYLPLGNTFNQNYLQFPM